jgi:phage FluMu protein Com
MTIKYSRRFSNALKSGEGGDRIIEVDSSKELRCSECNKKFLEGDLGSGGRISLKCSRCKTINTFMKIP